MLRLAFLLIIAVVAMLASWQIVTTDPGTVEVEWFGTQVSTSALFGLLILVAVIAVASVGFMMLTGRLNWRVGATVIIGCFILFGSAAIVSGIQSTATVAG